MLADQDLMAVQAVCHEMTETVTILTNAAGTESPFETNLLNIARQISGVSMNRIRIEAGDQPVFPGKPSLTLSDGETRNIHYLAAPEGRELPPFLDGLSWLGKGKVVAESAARQTLANLSVPVHLLLLIAEACPHCPLVVRSALALAIGRPMITLSVVDALMFEDVAERFKVKATPTIVANEGLTLVGQITTEQLANHLLQLGQADSLTTVLDSMIKSGRAEDAGRLLCRENRPHAILPIYLSKEFSVRMGALVALEEALENDPRVLDPIVEELTDLLFQEEVSLRGDTAELLGKIGHPGAIPALQKAAEDPDPDVQEAAREALNLLGH